MPIGELWPRPRDAVIDIALAALVAVTAFAPLDVPGTSGGGLAAVPFLAAAGVALLVRRRFPIVVLCIVAALGVTALVGGHRTPAIELPIAIAMYTVARDRTRTTTIGAAVLLGLVLSAAVLFTQIGSVRSIAEAVSPAVVQPAVLVAFAAALGSALKANRAVIDAANDRAHRAEATRDAEAQRRVAEDRLSIARDLHDSVAHRIAVINLHAGVAAGTLRSRPEEAEQAIAIIGEAARSVISEIQGMLLILRSGADGNPRSEPTLDRLDSLLSVFARSGLRVHYRIDGVLDGVGGRAGPAAYRVIQEGLTNAYKHGVGRAADLVIVRTESSVTVRITNPIAETLEPREAGHGILGMRERVSTAAGSITSTARNGLWELEAVLPVGDPEAADVADVPATVETT